MPRVRSSEMPQRLSTRGSAPLRTSSSDSDPTPLHHRPITDRSPKLGERRSPRGVIQPEPVNQKKLGTRIAGLESQLEQAQGELRILKEQLASVEAAKKQAQKELEKKSTKHTAPEPLAVRDKLSCGNEAQELGEKDGGSDEQVPDDDEKETDVFEVPVQKASPEPEVTQPIDQVEPDMKPVSLSAELSVISAPEKPPAIDELALKNDEISLLKVEMEEKEKELRVFVKENEILKRRLDEATSEVSYAKDKEEKMTSKLNQLGEELGKSKNNVAQLNDKLKEVEAAKEALETEMKRLRVQTEQWRKAADAAAAVLAGGMEVNGGRRVSERCGSMDKHYGGMFEAPGGGYAGFVGSPGLGDDSDDVFGGKRKGSGIRMFGDLWKKKGQK